MLPLDLPCSKLLEIGSQSGLRARGINVGPLADCCDANSSFKRFANALAS